LRRPCRSDQAPEVGDGDDLSGDGEADDHDHRRLGESDIRGAVGQHSGNHDVEGSVDDEERTGGLENLLPVQPQGPEEGHARYLRTRGHGLRLGLHRLEDRGLLDLHLHEYADRDEEDAGQERHAPAPGNEGAFIDEQQDAQEERIADDDAGNGAQLDEGAVESATLQR
jgi:hypothetical protein